MTPLQVVSALAFPNSPDELLDLAGQALTPIRNGIGQPVWDFNQGFQPLQPPSAGSFFDAFARYQVCDTNAYSERLGPFPQLLSLRLHARRQQPSSGHFCYFDLEFTDSYRRDGRSEYMVIIACWQMITRLVQRGWIVQDQVPGFWQLSTRGWSDPFIQRALHSDQDLFRFLADLRHYGMQAELDRNGLQLALGIRRLFNV